MIMPREKREIQKEDIMPLDVYTKQRKELRKSILELKKNRRVSLGPYATFYFESFETMYLNAWQRQVETAGYYEISRSDMIQGDYRVQIKSIIDHKGNLIDADILRSSGNSMLDALALKILYQSAPFEPFPTEMVDNYQQLEIIRDWNFSNS